MADTLAAFERITRNAHKCQQSYPSNDFRFLQHPFDSRNIYPAVARTAQPLFDNGHFAQATFEAFKFVDNEVARIAGKDEYGYKMMMSVLSEQNPIIRLTDCVTTTQVNEQLGYKFLFAGSILAIRNPRGREVNVRESSDDCLDHLALASILVRRLETAGHVIT